MNSSKMSCFNVSIGRANASEGFDEHPMEMRSEESERDHDDV
jgi:hypothetical protein